MRKSPNLEKVSSFAEHRFQDAAEARLANELLTEAREYLVSFPWCAEIKEEYVGIAIGGVVGVFLFRITPRDSDTPDWVWIVVGDLPSAYLPVEDALNPASALDAYIGAMEEWVRAVERGGETAGLIPVSATPTPENAQTLKRRLEFLDREILAQFQADLDE